MNIQPASSGWRYAPPPPPPVSPLPTMAPTIPPPVIQPAFVAPRRPAPIGAQNGDGWAWMAALWTFTPPLAGVGFAMGGLAGLGLGSAALGAAWGACIGTGVVGVVLTLQGFVLPFFQDLRRGKPIRPIDRGDLVAVGGLLLPTAVVAAGTALAVGTPLAAFGGILGSLVPVALAQVLAKLNR
jgi:hypothetical protein